ncbi:MAG: hypothetical protein FWE21_04635 [Defluviitaleaceae bacterium]|nr:hypothetical protein [Defluviitaleaceae bacterium]
METHVKYIISLFGLTAKGVNREKFGFLVATDQGSVALQKSNTTEENVEAILFQHEVKEFLYREGFDQTDRFYVTEKNLPYYKTSDDVYTASLTFAAPKVDFAKKQDFLTVVEHLGKMHKILMGANFAHKPKRRQEAIPPQKALENLATHRKKLMKAGKFSEFDMLFLRGYEKFAPHISSVSIAGGALGDNNYICHNLLKEENIYMADRPIFSNFATAGYGHYLSDLTYMVKRYLKAEPDGDLPLADIFGAYKAGHAEADINKDFFTAKLLYPDKFIKIARDYYSKNRSFAPKAYLARMEESLARGNALDGYIQKQ